MSIYIKDPVTDENVRKLAKLRGQTLTEAINSAVENELRRERRKDLPERLDALLAKYAHLPKSGLEADKTFYDDMSGDI
jgi:antitoxin VapB